MVEPAQFKDSLYIDEYARSVVTACQMAGIVKGYDNGFFQPDNTLTREECAAVVYRVMTAADMESGKRLRTTSFMVAPWV